MHARSVFVSSQPLQIQVLASKSTRRSVVPCQCYMALHKPHTAPLISSTHIIFFFQCFYNFWADPPRLNYFSYIASKLASQSRWFDTSIGNVQSHSNHIQQLSDLTIFVVILS